MAPSGSCSVVNYHGVLPSDYAANDPDLDGNVLPLEVFRRQLLFLKARYHIVHPEDFRVWIEQGKMLPPRSVLITCDDGPLNALTDMLPVLEKEAVSCLFFVTGASCSDQPGMLWYEELYLLLRAARTLGTELPGLPARDGDAATTSASLQSQWWDMVQAASRFDAEARANWMASLRSRCGTATFDSERRWRLLNRQELIRLAEAGMGIGAHTLTHPVLAQCSESEARREIQGSKVEIERALGRPVWAFAYPFCHPSTMGEREVRMAQEAGFTCAFLNVGGGSADRSRPLELRRTHVSADMNLAEIEAHMVGFHTRLQRTVRG